MVAGRVCLVRGSRAQIWIPGSVGHGCLVRRSRAQMWIPGCVGHGCRAAAEFASLVRGSRAQHVVPPFCPLGS
eukprot:4376456-Prymnesium_polylepis.1